MRVQLGCYECVTKRALRLAELMTEEPERRRGFVDTMLKTFLGMRPHCSTPEISGEFNRIFAEHTGIYDFFKEQKRLSTRLGLELLPSLQNMVEKSGNPFETALLFAISGNVIDYGMNPDFTLDAVEDRIRGVVSEPFDREAACRLEAEMNRAEHIIYVLDNCGEAVIDRLLIERFPGKITVAVRGNPIFNDATRQDAIDSGIGAPIIESGSALPGVSRNCCSPEFLAELDRADLIIAKGQGNFESIEECNFGPAFFLMRVKCAVVSEKIGAPLNSIQIIGHNLK